jgi:hypothetical protein
MFGVCSGCVGWRSVVDRWCFFSARAVAFILGVEDDLFGAVSLPSCGYWNFGEVPNIAPQQTIAGLWSAGMISSVIPTVWVRLVPFHCADDYRRFSKLRTALALGRWAS